jgi:hypothetical protein
MRICVRDNALHEYKPQTKQKIYPPTPSLVSLMLNEKWNPNTFLCFSIQEKINCMSYYIEKINYTHMDGG